jgi:ribosomal 30S subunit maturation factor RimM
VGLITKAFGIRGEVKVNPSTDEPRKRFAKGKR